MADTEFAVEGLSAAIGALNRFDKEAGKEARGILGDGAKIVQTAAQRNASVSRGRGLYRRPPGMIRRQANRQGAGVKLAGKRYPYAWGAEYGARKAWVFGNVTLQTRLKRRQFAPWRGNKFVVRGRSGPGWLIQPAIRANLDDIVDKTADELDDLLDRVMTKAGVPRSKGAGF